MTFIITLYVREGIVMASDSRLTFHSKQQEEDSQIIQLAVGLTDSHQKLFLGAGNIGIATFGAAEVEGVPIAGYIESFMDEYLAQGDYSVEEVPPTILEYFRALPGPPNAGFIVAGYQTVEGIAEQHVWETLVGIENVKKVNKPNTYGAWWRGETDILARLVQPVGHQGAEGTFKPLPHYHIQWRFFTLQDAIDYAIYAVRATIDTMRFQPRPKTVGGPIDVLVIKPNEAFWVQRKALHA